MLGKQVNMSGLLSETEQLFSPLLYLPLESSRALERDKGTLV